MSKELRHAVLHPEDAEPLALTASPGLLAAAKAEGANLVAHISDGQFNLGAFCWTLQLKPASVSQFYKILGIVGVDGRRDGDWRIVTPYVSEPPADRGAIGSFLRVLDATGKVRLEDYATYAAAVGRSAEPAISSYYRNALFDASGYLSPGQWMELRFYGLLRQSERRDLAAGKTVDLAGVPEAARNVLIEHITTSPYLNLEELDATGGPARSKGGLSIRNDPTEVLAAGFGSASAMRENVYSDLGVLVHTAKNEKSTGDMHPLSLRNLAEQSLRNEISGINDRLEGGGVDQVVPGQQSYVRLTCLIRKDLQFVMSFNDYDYDLRGKPMRLQDLPERYTKQLQAQVDDVRREFAGRPKPATGNNAPPP